MRDNEDKRRLERPGEDGPDDSLDALLSSYTPRQREKVLNGLRILARVAIRSYMEEEAESQAEDNDEWETQERQTNE